MTNVLLVLLLIVSVVLLYFAVMNYIENAKASKKLEEVDHSVECIKKDIYKLHTLYDMAQRDLERQYDFIEAELRSIKTDKQRMEAQEKLIAELKSKQAPDEVIDTIDLINEWMNGPKEG